MVASVISRVPSRLLWLASILLVVLSGCTPDPATTGAPDEDVPVHVEPSRLVFHPETDDLQLDIVNDGPAPVDLAAFTIDGADWEAFTITDERNPRAVAPGERVSLTVRNAPQAMAIEDAQGHETGEYREGSARLRFVADREPLSVPLQFEAPSVWVEYVLPALVKVLVLVLAFIMPLASLLTWLERKQSAMMQDRVGPNMAGIPLFGTRLRLWGLLHIAADGLKMLFKEDFVPSRAHKPLYALAPLLAFIPALVVFAIIPFGDGLCYGNLGDVLSQADVDQCVDGRGGTPLQIAHIDVGLLFYFAVASLSAYAATLAGWSGYNKWGILGGLRASAQMISYEVAIGLTIVGALLVYGSLEPHTLVHAQLDTYWGIVFQPIAFLLFFTAAMAETKRTPFDLPEGESEIIGYFIEYSGMRFGLFFLGEFIEIVFMSALVVTIFFGGWALPLDMLGASGFASPLIAQLFFLVAGLIITITGIAAWRASKHAENLGVLLVMVGVLHLVMALFSAFTGWGTELPHFAVILIGLITWGVKVAAFCWLQLLIRWTLPRFRYDQLMRLGWKGLLPLSLANVVITAILVYLLLPGGEVP